jgi:hypothetical protein
MIGGPGPTPNLLRQYELGTVPKEMAEDNDATREHHDAESKKDSSGTRRRWWRFFRRG